MTNRPAPGAARRHIAVWLGCVLLAVNLLAAAFPPAHSADSAQSLFAQFLVPSGGQIEICAIDGPIIVDATGQPVSGSHGSHDLCVFCLPLMHGTAALPAVSRMPDDPGRLVAVLAPPAALRNATAERRLTPYSPRAPPFV